MKLGHHLSTVLIFIWAFPFILCLLLINVFLLFYPGKDIVNQKYNGEEEECQDFQDDLKKD